VAHAEAYFVNLKMVNFSEIYLEFDKCVALGHHKMFRLLYVLSSACLKIFSTSLIVREVGRRGAP
jgi:hypothetical protein